MGAIAAISVLIPITNVITGPIGVLGGVLAGVVQDELFLKTDAGKDMMKYYRKAASLGHSGAAKRIKAFEGNKK